MIEYKVTIVAQPEDIEAAINRWAAEGMTLHSLHQEIYWGGQGAGKEWIVVMQRSQDSTTPPDHRPQPSTRA